jgi:hypothetical protein
MGRGRVGHLSRVIREERMRYAFDCGCDLAVMVTEAASDSQRNAEREGFRIAYARSGSYRVGPRQFDLKREVGLRSLNPL